MKSKDEEAFSKLVQEVSIIDSEAARILSDEIPLDKNVNFIHDGDLSFSFIWESSPQGFDYWDDIYTKLGKELYK